MLDSRASGILLHPTSFPGRGGIGELGSAAYRFVDWLHAAGQRLWQILPLSPTGYGDSPYASFSASAGNPLLISLEILASEGLIEPHHYGGEPASNDDLVDFGAVISWKTGVLREAYESFKRTQPPQLVVDLESFTKAEAGWLDDYALFRALKDEHGGSSWSDWDRPVALREPAALDQARQRLADEVEFQRFLQFMFFRQWRSVKAYANRHGIQIIGDVPIFVAYDSSDVWAHREIFKLDQQGKPTVVAGVPPDYFSATGQLWGNPHYRWDVLEKQGYGWWADRIKATLSVVDIIRIDHFRGFEAAWEVPAGDETAVNGRWVSGPGAAFFTAMREKLGVVPFIAEDLGIITPEVEALREAAGLPGMKVLQFAWDGDPRNLYLPHNHIANSIVYTGTHDNDTTIGWFSTTEPNQRYLVHIYTGTEGRNIAWDFIRMALSSVANTAVVPLQDVLSLGTHARMNQPGRPVGNWGWRYREGMLTEDLAEQLRRVTWITGRLQDTRREA